MVARNIVATTCLPQKILKWIVAFTCFCAKLKLSVWKRSEFEVFTLKTELHPHYVISLAVASERCNLAWQEYMTTGPSCSVKDQPPTAWACLYTTQPPWSSKWKKKKTMKILYSSILCPLYLGMVCSLCCMKIYIYIYMKCKNNLKYSARLGPPVDPKVSPIPLNQSMKYWHSLFRFRD